MNISEAEDLNNFIDLLNGYPSDHGGDYQYYVTPSEEDIQTNADNFKTTDNFIQEMKRLTIYLYFIYIFLPSHFNNIYTITRVNKPKTWAFV